jgi:transposase
MNKKYIVRLTSAEQEQLEQLVRKGKTVAYKIRHAHILLSVDSGGLCWSDEQAATAFHCDINTVRNIRQRFVESGLESALNHKKQVILSRKPLLDGAGEARLIALGCSRPPEGYDHWTLKLLSDKLIELKVVTSISGQTVHRVLKKMNSSHICASVGVFRQSKMRIS